MKFRKRRLFPQQDKTVNETVEPARAADGCFINRCRDSEIIYSYRCAGCRNVTENTTETTSRKAVSLGDIPGILFERIKTLFRFRVSQKKRIWIIAG